MPSSSPEAALLLVSTKNRDLPLARSNTGSPRFTAFPSLCACSESSLTNLIGSGLNLLCLQSHSKPECRWAGPEVAILGADQKERGLWGRECSNVGHLISHLILGLNSGAVPRIGLSSRCTCPFWVLPFFSLFSYVWYPIKLLKKSWVTIHAPFYQMAFMAPKYHSLDAIIIRKVPLVRSPKASSSSHFHIPLIFVLYFPSHAVSDIFFSFWYLFWS